MNIIINAISFYIWKLGYFKSIVYNKIKFKVLLGKSCSFDLKIGGKLNVRLHKNSKLLIGKKFHSLNGKFYNPISRNTFGSILVEEGGILKIGNNSGMSSSVIWVKESVSLGNNVNIGADTLIIDSDCHSLNFTDRRSRGTADNINTKSTPVVIEDDVLVGARSIILKGVTIGARSIIGAGSVVTKNIPSDCIAAGNPCNIIKSLKS
jgi:acetyltransferase-like isoleucine patch superfamily enzyme